MVDDVYHQYAQRIGTGQLNRILETATVKNPPPLHRGKPIKFYYSTQVTTKPPTFVCFVNHPQAVHFSYKRFLINQIRSKPDSIKRRFEFYSASGKIVNGKSKKESKTNQ